MIKNKNNNYKYILNFYYFQQKINKEKDEELNNIYTKEDLIKFQKKYYIIIFEMIKIFMSLTVYMKCSI